MKLSGPKPLKGVSQVSAEARLAAKASMFGDLGATTPHPKTPIRVTVSPLGSPENIAGRRPQPRTRPGMRRSLLLLSASLLAGPLHAQTPAWDLVIRGGRIVDGTGAPAYFADLAINGGRIATIGRLDPARARRVIDATGMVVTPGFIDLMGQTGAPFLRDPASAYNLLSQGITTLNAGEGESDAPLGGEEATRRGWTTMREFFRVLESAGMPMNVAQTVGHTQLRQLVIGDVDRQATPAELERMKAMVQEAMEAGAIGVSTSLIYPPAIYGSEEEIAALAAVAGRYGGRYFTHMRNEGDRL